MKCDLFSLKRSCFVGRMRSILPGFKNMSSTNQLKTILWPTSTAATKIINKFIRIMFLARDSIEEGNNLDEMSYPTMPVNYDFVDLDNLCDLDEWDLYSNLSNNDYDHS